MRYFYGKLVLSVRYFEAEDNKEAELMLDNYLDSLETLINSNPKLPIAIHWEDCDFKVTEVEKWEVEDDMCDCGNCYER